MAGARRSVGQLQLTVTGGGTRGKLVPGEDFPPLSLPPCQPCLERPLLTVALVLALPTLLA